MNSSNYHSVSGVIFVLMAIGQLSRLVLQIPIQIGTINVPLWSSVIAFLVPLFMAIWAFRSAGKSKNSKK